MKAVLGSLLVLARPKLLNEVVCRFLGTNLRLEVISFFANRVLSQDASLTNKALPVSFKRVDKHQQSQPTVWF